MSHPLPLSIQRSQGSEERQIRQRQKGRVSNFSTCRLGHVAWQLPRRSAQWRSGQVEGRRRLPTGPLSRKFAAAVPKTLYFGEL